MTIQFQGELRQHKIGLFYCSRLETIGLKHSLGTRRVVKFIIQSRNCGISA